MEHPRAEQDQAVEAHGGGECAFPFGRLERVVVDHFFDQLVHVRIAGGVDAFCGEGNAIELGAAVAVEIGAAFAVFGEAQIEDARIECGIDMDAAEAAIAA